MRLLFILTGIPGSGKSYSIKQLQLEHLTLSTDTLRVMNGTLLPYIDKSSNIDSFYDNIIFEQLMQILENRMTYGQTTILDITSFDNLNDILDLAEVYRYKVIYVIYERYNKFDEKNKNIRKRKINNIIPYKKLEKNKILVKELKKQHKGYEKDIYKAVQKWDRFVIDRDTFNNYDDICVIPDLHGCYGVFSKFLEDNNILQNKKTAYIFLGDYIDRGEDNTSVIESIIQLASLENVYLIIEEINRGNCAQIFGDLFQLLDRDENGASEYTIKADTDLKVFLEGKLGKDKPGIEDGELCLPSNLYIYATMNTSDQSLFPIDSAFKRRWDWEYEPIKYKNEDWVIEVQEDAYSWVSFQKEINKRIFDATSSEDKMLGDYFVNPSDGVITEKMLLNKILFYLWNDVCKDGEGDIFKVSETEDVSFSELYGDEGKDKLIAMLDYLDVDVYDDDDNTSNVKNKRIKYSINGKGEYAKKYLPAELIKSFIEQNPNMTSSEVIEKWNSLGKFVSHFVENQTDYDVRKDNKTKRTKRVSCGSDMIYVSTRWSKNNAFDNLINAIPEDWNLKVEKLS